MFSLLFFFLSIFFSFLVYFISFGGVVLSYGLMSFLGLDFCMSFMFDLVSLYFFCSVSFISMMVFFYSFFYMSGVVMLRRFFWLVFGFVLSMLLLVFSGSFLMTMVGWDGLGLVSFCLVVFYSNYLSIESGLVTVFSNRVGDVFFLGSLSFFFLGSSGMSDFSEGSFLFIWFLLLGAFTKSAQLPFSSWLPAAMAAPTPVSSLVHSSTLVTAGVYVLLRFNYLFWGFDFLYVKFFFLFTMVLSGFCACLEMDLKKIVAMSTLSQLGLMMFVLSIGLWELAFFHMIIHAFFKSMLFLNTGKLMMALGGGQDSRFYGSDFLVGGVFMCFFVSSLCLMGFPFLIGFYSKDVILCMTSFLMGSFYYYLFLGGCVLTVYYSFRLLALPFKGLGMFVSFVSVLENWFFFSSISFLFGFCCLGGCVLVWGLGFIYQSLGFLDLTIGLFLIIFVSFMYCWGGGFYSLFFFFMSLGVLRWFSGGSSSQFLGKFYFSKWDSSWFEVLGGRGVYFYLQSFHFFDLFKNTGLGVVFLGFLMFLIF